jgi:phycobilisome rod-core linker protein
MVFIPMLEYSPTSQNQRVTSFEVPGDEQPRVFTTENLVAASELDALIAAAYRQVFHEQQMLASNRQTYLESQLRSGQITVRQFVAGLATSDAFRRLNFDVNNNYRFVEICVQRLLGRNTYSEREKIAWSAVVMTKGVKTFINELLNSDEYITAFGDHTVPYQRRRVLPKRAVGELPFERTAVASSQPRG